MEYIKLAQNGEFFLLIIKQTDKRGIIFNQETGEKWEDQSIVSTLSKYGWEFTPPEKVDISNWSKSLTSSS